jgi:hypothetical protein
LEFFTLATLLVFGQGCDHASYVAFILPDISGCGKGNALVKTM